MFMELADIDKRCPRGLNQSAVSAHVWQTEPFSANCLRTFFNDMNLHLRRFSELESTIYTTIYVIISLFALIGNGVVILAVIRKKEMRTNRNVLIVNLAASNLMLAITTIPFLWLPSMHFDFPYSNFFCKFANALPGSNIYCSTLTICVMAIDRYYSVKSIKIGVDKTRCLKAVSLSFSIWIISFLLSFPLLIYYNTSMLYVFKDVWVFDEGTNTTMIQSYGWRQCRLESSNNHVEESDESETRTIQLAMSLLQVMFLYIVPLIVLSIFNMKLTHFLKMNAKHVNRTRGPGVSTHHRGSFALPNDTYLLTEYTETDKSARHVVVQTTDKFTSAERASERRRSKTTALLVAMAMAYAVLWFPFTFVSVLIDLNILNTENNAELIERVDQACKLISILSICVNPFLYGFLNTNFRREFTDIFKTLAWWYRPSNERCSSTNSNAPINQSQISSLARRTKSLSFRRVASPTPPE
uniref:G-protein coupled receptors family 1 profile domain-containing protein n=1 Tax=Panagrolaimus sp. JU765 TaxID=591449 RepID=A0AC34Q1T9_9BILA